MTDGKPDNTEEAKRFRLEYASKWHRQHAETGFVYLRAAIDFGLEAIRTAALINGGAVIACMAFLGALQQAKPASPHLLGAVWDGALFFTIGVVAAGAASGFAYFSQYCYANEHNAIELTWEHPYERAKPSQRWWDRAARTFQFLAASAVIASYGLLIYGAFGVYAARSW